MRFYSSVWRSSYQELLAYYPRFLQEVYEIQAILKACGEIADDYKGQIETIYNNSFIQTADESTIRMWELTLGIVNRCSLTLDQRKAVIIAHITGHGHIGDPEIKEIVSWYSSGNVATTLIGGRVKIEVDDLIFDVDSLYNELLARLPAHLGLGLYNITSVAMGRAVVHFGSVFGTLTHSAMPVIELDYGFISDVPVACVFGRAAQDRLPAVEQDYLFDTKVHSCSGMSGSIIQNVFPTVERSYGVHEELGTAGHVQSIMVTTIKNLDS